MSLTPIDNEPQVRPLGTQEGPPSGGRWIAAVIAGVVAVGAIVLFVTSRPSQQNTGDSVPEVAETTDTTPEVDDRPLALQVPGLNAGLVGVVADEGSLDAWTWPADIPVPLELDTGPEIWAQWDAYGNFLAELRDVGRRHAALYFGRPDNVREVFRDVREFVWHDSAAGDIAWVTAEAQPQLWHGRSAVVSGLRSLFSSQIAPVDEALGRLAAYGDWGFAFQTDPGDGGRPLITVLDPEGQLVTSAAGLLLDTTAGGRIIVESLPQGTAMVETDIHFANGRALPSNSIGPPMWSPDGSTYAVVTSDEGSQSQLELWEDGRLIRSLALTMRQASPISWSQDGRWLVLGNIFIGGQPSRTIVVIDLGDSSQHAIELAQFPVQVIVPGEPSTQGTAESGGEVTSASDPNSI